MSLVSLVKMNIMQEITMQEIDVRYAAKIPVQTRSKLRFNKILAIAEEMVLADGIDEISPHKIAKRAQIPPASVYQYFPSMGALFSTMAEMHFVKAFDLVNETIENTSIRSWRDLATILVDGAYDFYNKDKISEILFLGIYLAPGVRELSAQRLTRFGLWYAEKFALLYKKSDLEQLPEKLSLCIEVMKGVYIRCLNVHGELKPAYKEEARILVMNYLQDFFQKID